MTSWFIGKITWAFKIRNTYYDKKSWPFVEHTHTAGWTLKQNTIAGNTHTRTKLWKKNGWSVNAQETGQTCWGMRRHKWNTSFFSATKTVIQCCWGIGAVPLKFKESLLSGSGFFITFGDYIQTWSPFLLFFKFLHSFTLYSSPPLDPCFFNKRRADLWDAFSQVVCFFSQYFLTTFQSWVTSIIHSLTVKLNRFQPSFNIFFNYMPEWQETTKPNHQHDTSSRRQAYTIKL